MKLSSAFRNDTRLTSAFMNGMKLSSAFRNDTRLTYAFRMT